VTVNVSMTMSTFTWKFVLGGESAATSSVQAKPTAMHPVSRLLVNTNIHLLT
jgi:hypothetical protein